MVQPFFFPGSSTGCLFVHGFAGSPSEMRSLGEYVHAQEGYTVLGVLLAGHGGMPEQLRGLHWREWLASAEQGLQELRRQCSRVFVVGFSMGGALSIMLAHSWPIDRLVLLSTPLMLKGDWRVGILPLLRYVVPWYYPLEEANLDDPFVQHRIREHAPEIDLSDPAVREQVRRQVRLPMGAIDELRKALRHARAYVPTVCVPTLVMHGIEDDVAPPASADELMMRLGSSDKQIVWWDRTGHYLLFDGPHRDAIYRRVAMFLLSDEDERV